MQDEVIQESEQDEVDEIKEEAFFVFFYVQILIFWLKHSLHMLDHCWNIVALFGHLRLLPLLMIWNPSNVDLLNVYQVLS